MNNLYHIRALLPPHMGRREERIYTVVGRPQAYRRREELQTALTTGTRVYLPVLQPIDNRSPVTGD